MSVPKELINLWKQDFFLHEKTIAEIKLKLSSVGVNPRDEALRMAVARSNFLIRIYLHGQYKIKQKYPFKRVSIAETPLPERLINELGQDFKPEINDLKLNFGQSGTCTAFLLRKILEKLIFLTFAKNGQLSIIKDKQGHLVGLKDMLRLSTTTYVEGIPYLLPKVVEKIEGIKFLGDSAAHDPIANVDMETILPCMAFITTALEQLSAKLKPTHHKIQR